MLQYDALTKDNYRKQMVTVPRSRVFCVATYQTVSELTLYVIARVIPIDLLAREKREEQ